MIETYDFSIATDCTSDWDFIQLLEQVSHEQGLKTYIVQPFNLIETIKKVQNKELTFSFYYDRASDTSYEFLDLYNLLVDNNVPVLDSIENLNWAADKTIMHKEFIAKGIHTPYTLIIPSHDTLENIYVSINDLAKLGRSFIIKPATTSGGGIGVANGAETLQDVLNARQQYRSDQYLLQERVIPLEKNGLRFWFRGFFACGFVECCWWSDITHVYELITDEQADQYHLEPLYSLVQKIAEICKLNFFSTEIVLNSTGQFIVIDYVNEICDMRLKSNHLDGVPNETVNRISHNIAQYVNKQIFFKKSEIG